MGYGIRAAIAKPSWHGDNESPAENTLRELYKRMDISRSPTNGLRRKSTKLVDIELTSMLCKAKIIVEAEWKRY